MQAYIITLLFPIFGLFYSFLRWTRKHSKNVFWIFCAFAGLVFIFQQESETLGYGADGGRYALDLIYMHDNIHSFTDLLGILYTGSELDIYQPMITFFVSRVTDNAHWLFFVFALIYGFFYSRNLWFVFERFSLPFPNVLWILIVFYILVCPIWNINGVRMWTALQVFVYGAMPYLVSKDNRKIIWCFISLLIHFSFAIPLVILLAYKLVPVKDKLGMAFIFYIITLFVSSLDLAFFREIIQSIPILESRVVYLSDVYAETVSEAKALNSFHVVLSENISYWLIQILIVAVYFCYNRYKRMQSEALTRLFVFSLLIYGFSNLLSLAPSGGRFIVLSKMFMLPLIILVLMRLKDVALVRKVMFAPVLLLFPIIFELRVGMDYYGIMLFLGNFFTAPFIVSDIPLIDFVKQSIL